MGVEAWVTSAWTDLEAKKAIVLAWSLRRTRTAKKLVVFIPADGNFSKEIREKLERVFDQVLERSLGGNKTSKNYDKEDWAKFSALTLGLAKRCVYLSPNTLVLKNSDDIFDKDEKYAACLLPGEKWDTSVWLLTPDKNWKGLFELEYGSLEDSPGFLTWLENKGTGVGKLEKKYNVKTKLNLDGETELNLEDDICIVNFGSLHPLECMEHLQGKSLGPVEKCAVNLCLDIHAEQFTFQVTKSGSLENYNYNYEKEPIAVVGLSFRLPKANDVNEFWSMLVEGREGIHQVPEQRWTRQQSCYPCYSRKMEAGFLKVPIDQFDAKFFGISPKDAEYLDPQQRLLHEISWEALEDAMIDPLSLQGSDTSFFIGSWIYDYQAIVSTTADLDFLRCYMGNSIAASAARLSHFYGTTGPSVGTESGCSAGIVAVDMAMKSLRNKTSNLALAGGVNLILHPFDRSKLSFVVAPDGRCKTFDSKADGFGRAEGCAVLVMKRLSDAVRDGDNIWGLLRGSAMRQEGTSKSLGTPTVHSESLAMELALEDAGVSPLEVSYIETHGTGTPVGDPLEIAAIAKAYSKGRQNPVLIGSVKTNVGHTESLSGITGIIKVLLSMKNELIPRHRNLETLNPNINLSLIPAEIPMENVAWPKKSTPRIAGVSSFGISGTDAHVIVEEPPMVRKPLPVLNDTKERPLHILKVSAKSQESLQEILQKYEEVLSGRVGDSSIDFGDFAYSVNSGRATFNRRAYIIAKDSSSAAKIIQEKSFQEANVQSSSNKLCFLFTGQGSQYPNMAKNLHETSSVFRYHFDKCDQILQSKYKISLKPVLWSDSSSSEELSRTLYSQTSIFVVEYCLLKLWESYGVKPDFVLGHSLGEFAAAVAAGALTFTDALTLVAERSRLIDNLPRGKMLVIRAEKRTVDDAIHSFQQNNKNFWVDYAAINSPDQTVVAGDSEMIQEFAKYCGTRSLKTIVLAATHAFHSRHMDPMLEQYKKIASTITRPTPEDSAPQYISGMEGRLIDTDSIDAGYWVRHTREMVRFTDACKSIQSEGCTMFLEVGPHPVLSAMAMMNIEERITCLPSLRRKEEEWSTILETLGKLYLSEWAGQVDWKGLDKFSSRKRVPVPFYQFNRKPIWPQFQRIRADLHPLLGKVLPTATSETLFEKIVTLKNASFAEDHVIGNTVVFPGAGYLEMCLIGGLAASQGLTEQFIRPRRPVLIRKLTISLPLALYDSSTCRLQTTISMEDHHQLDKKEENDQMGYTVKVHRSLESTENEGPTKWALHATGKFQPIVASFPGEVLRSHNGGVVDINELQKTGTNRTAKIRTFYEKTQKLGLRFGPKFQSLQNGWRKGDEMMSSINVPEDYGDYLIHPIVADAMLQSMMLWKQDHDEDDSKLQVPVHIGEFIWLKPAESREQFVYCCINDRKETYCLLLDKDGSPLAYMKDVQFIQTTVKLIEGILQQKNTGLPKLWKEVWKQAPGPMQNSMDVSTEIEFKYDPETEEILEKANDVGDEERRYYANIVQMTRIYSMEAMYKLGWKNTGGAFTVEEVVLSLGVLPCHRRFLRFFIRQFLDKFNLEELPKAGDAGEEQYRFTKPPPSFQELEDDLQRIRRETDQERIEYRLLSKIGKNLDKGLTGEIEVLPLLFPNDPSEPSAAAVYDVLVYWSKKIQRSGISQTLKKICAAAEAKHLEKNPLNSTGSPCLRVLEIGAGSGTITKEFLELFQNLGQRHKYYFTDISSAFFLSAEKLFQDHLDNLVFQKFDMEKDPLEQGFTPGYFDVILACEVIHISEYMDKTLRNIRTLLKPGGSFIFFEHIVPDPRITFIFGMLEGYWRCKDRDHATLTRDSWKNSLEKASFERVHVMPYYDNIHAVVSAFASSSKETHPLLELYPKKNTWLVFGEDTIFTEKILEKLHGVNRSVITVSKSEVNLDSEEETKSMISRKFQECFQHDYRLEGTLYLWGILQSEEERDQSRISLPFVNLCQEVISLSGSKQTPKIFVVTQGISELEPIDVLNPNPATLSGIIRALSNEDTLLKICNVDLPPNDDKVEHVQELFLNLWTEGIERLVALRSGQRFTPKFVSAKFGNNEALTLPTGCDRFQLVLPPTKVISDLEYSYLNPYILQENEVEVKVQAIALNFRDVFTVIKPTKQFEKINSVGLEFSGVVTRVGGSVTRRKCGDRVIGLNLDPELSMPSHVKIIENMVVPLPDKMTFAQGATLPTVFLTAAYCLLDVAQMKKGDTILIHTASGGVGLCAVQLAQHVGANIIATAGSPRKRRYLKNLGIRHIFNSRTTQYGKQILECTGGKRVNIVLNSLTGEGFKEASLGALAPHGRFIEMSKLNVWTPEEVTALRPDVFYKIVDVTTLAKEELSRLNDELERYMNEGIIKAIAFECFDALNIRGALNHMQKAKHIGKIVCVMPEVSVANSKCTVSTPLFNEGSTYLVTGGLGGIGYEVVKRMLQQGAKHLVIVSRSKPKPEVASQIDAWNKAGKHVEAFAVDIGDYQQCQELIQKISGVTSGFPKLRGVMHAAGTLQDGLLVNQTWSSFRKTYNAKVNGTWNLHRLTMDTELEHFVLFSSLASQCGSPAQTNHAASNSFMDAFASYRRSNGLPATSINWGNWGEVGVATELDLPGILPISTSQGLLALETSLRTQTPRITVLNVESFKLSSSYFPSLKNYLDDSRLFGETRSAVIVNSDDFWKEVDSAKDLQGKKSAFKKYIKITARGILKMSQDEAIEDTADFQSLGIDSLMMLEMRNGMQNILGSRLTLSVNQLKDCSNTEQLAQRLVDILETEAGEGGEKKNGDGSALQDEEELKKLIREDCLLRPRMDQDARRVAKIRNVLLTGATGQVGPYILKELTSRKEIQRVYCLLRKLTEVTGEDRLRKRLQEMNLLEKVDSSKVVYLEGDITQEKLGLSEKEYDTLAESTDAVVHLAAKVEYEGSYSKDPQDASSIRNVNVLGTVNVLEFAGRKTLKHVLFPSTLMSVVEVDKDGNIPETWQAVGAFDHVKIKMSYEISKHVSEQIIRGVMEEDKLPCKIFRYPYIGGESLTGQVSLENNEVLLRWLTFMRLGFMPDFPAPIGVVSVDRCCEVTLEAFLSPTVPPGVYHVMQKDVEMEQELITIASELGINIQTVPYAVFKAKLMELVKSEGDQGGTHSYFATVNKFYDRGESVFSEHLDFSSVKSLKTYYEKSGSIVNKLKLTELLPKEYGFPQRLENMREVMKRDLAYLKRTGVFKIFGIDS